MRASSSPCPARQGKGEDDIAKAAKLFAEIYQQIDSKQLKPFIRTQYMRSAFQARRYRTIPAARAPQQDIPVPHVPVSVP